MADALRPVLIEKIAEIEARLPELQLEAQKPELMKDATRAKKLFREIGRSEKLVSLRDRCVDLQTQIDENEELAAAGDELAELANEELPELRTELEKRREELESTLLDDDEYGDRNAMIELRAGTGGDEAALFARDLGRIYERYAEQRGWKMKPVSISESELGGYKEAVFSMEGEDVFRVMRFESGGHRVQRVPVTESQGRVHTSAATVAVLPEAEEVELHIDEQDLEIQTTTSSGPGGQHVNKTESAVRITHKPSGLVVFCQEERSQHKNKSKAMKLLRSRLLDHEARQRQSERAEARKSQIGSGDRSQRVRTYNFPQNRCTDHRTGQNYSLEKVEGGDLGPVHQDLLMLEKDEKLREL
jgi:peptide chain release factor 1